VDEALTRLLFEILQRDLEGGGEWKYAEKAHPVPGLNRRRGYQDVTG
jgi:hypothetical protein